MVVRCSRVVDEVRLCGLTEVLGPAGALELLGARGQLELAHRRLPLRLGLGELLLQPLLGPGLRGDRVAQRPLPLPELLAHPHGVLLQLLDGPELVKRGRLRQPRQERGRRVPRVRVAPAV